MRVIAGVAKGRKLVAPATDSVRPSKDRLKEALFSSLGMRIIGARVLDLYAGSGALGIEALSRGAASATFVESDPEAQRTIHANLLATGLTGSATVLGMTAEVFVERSRAGPFDVVLIDPPYSLGLPSEVLAGMAAGGVVAPGARVVVEVSSRRIPEEGVASYREVARKRYGDSSLIYFDYRAGN